MNLLTTDELISTIGGLLIQWDETFDFDGIVISGIFTLWLKLGLYSFHYHSNTITDNYNWYFAKKIGDLSGFQNVSGI